MNRRGGLDCIPGVREIWWCPLSSSFPFGQQIVTTNVSFPFRVRKKNLACAHWLLIEGFTASGEGWDSHCTLEVRDVFSCTIRDE